MKRFSTAICIGICLTACASAAIYGAQSKQAKAKSKQDRVQVVIETSLGNIEVEVDAKHAPVTAANFLRYVDEAHYEGGKFHRTVTPKNQPDKKVKIQVVQAGPNPDKKDHDPILLERTNKTGLRHKNGTISMARDGADTATSDFFVCIGDQPSLDYGGKRNPDGQGFAAFGHVVKGMEIIRKIQASPSNSDQALTPPITIARIRRLKP